VEILDKKLNSLFSRRTFLAGAGGVAAATMVAGCSDSSVNASTTAPSGTYTDADILNFALNLEYLEAQFYLYAATGKGLATTDTTGGSASGFTTAGTVTLGNAAAIPALLPAQQQIVNEIAYEEQSM
jgi:Ferritin-like domain/TAT (twin-arginine translocation) pathway signal sequence